MQLGSSKAGDRSQLKACPLTPGRWLWLPTGTSAGLCVAPLCAYLASSYYGGWISKARALEESLMVACVAFSNLVLEVCCVLLMEAIQTNLPSIKGREHRLIDSIANGRVSILPCKDIWNEIYWYNQLRKINSAPDRM